MISHYDSSVGMTRQRPTSSTTTITTATAVPRGQRPISTTTNPITTAAQRGTSVIYNHHVRNGGPTRTTTITHNYSDCYGGITRATTHINYNHDDRNGSLLRATAPINYNCTNRAGTCSGNGELHKTLLTSTAPTGYDTGNSLR